MPLRVYDAAIAPAEASVSTRNGKLSSIAASEALHEVFFLEAVEGSTYCQYIGIGLVEKEFFINHLIIKSEFYII